MYSSTVKSTIKSALAGLYYTAGPYLEHLNGRITILMYHRVLSDFERAHQVVQQGMFVSSEVFERHILFLKDHFTIISHSELLDLWKRNKVNSNHRYCVITFDDGWIDNYLYAYPILKKYNVPATIFLPTNFIGTNEWFWTDKLSYIFNYYYSHRISSGQVELTKKYLDRYAWIMNPQGRTHIEKIDYSVARSKRLAEGEVEYLIETLSMLLDLKIPDERRVMNWEEIKEMSNSNISFGSHSCNHKILTNYSDRVIRKEIQESLIKLQESGINHIPVFCYPNGNYTPGIAEMVKIAKYEAAVTTIAGSEGHLPQDIYGLKRLCIHEGVAYSDSMFTFHISGLNRISSLFKSPL